MDGGDVFDVLFVPAGCVFFGGFGVAEGDFANDGGGESSAEGDGGVCGTVAAVADGGELLFVAIARGSFGESGAAEFGQNLK